jgi:hypothetical protein
MVILSFCIQGIFSPCKGGVCIGLRRDLVICSNAYPNPKRLGSLKGRPKKEIPTGNPLLVNPAGTIRSGKPLRLARLVAETAGSSDEGPRFSPRGPGRRGEVG